MKVLHIASFTGNIGDNANHLGMRSKLESMLGQKPEYTELEIRYCYRIYTGPDRWQFDDSFVSLANDHDMIIIGGGNFFEPWLDESANATTINITNERLKNIRKPLVFYGVGFDIHKGISNTNLNKFIGFVDQCIEQKNIFLSFRNDGSLKNFKIAFPNRKDLFSLIDVVPDGGFFYDVQESSANYLQSGKYIGINIASDMKELRFPEAANTGWDKFLNEMADFLQVELNQHQDKNVILFPHIYKDVLSIGELMERLDDRLCRGRVIVAPFACGWSACQHIFSLYKQCQLVLGMRFHSNVCSIAMGIPAIPLATYPKLIDLYQEIGMGNRIVIANKEGFSQDIRSNPVFLDPKSCLGENSHLLSELNSLADKFFKRISL